MVGAEGAEGGNGTEEEVPVPVEETSLLIKKVLGERTTAPPSPVVMFLLHEKREHLHRRKEGKGESGV